MPSEMLPEGERDPVAEAEAEVRAYAGWHIAPNRADTDSFRSYGGPVLLLKSLHVTAVASVTIDGTAIADYQWYENGVLRREAGWPCGKVEVEFTHGYDVVAIGDLYGVITALAARGGSTGAYVQVGQVRVAVDSSGAPLGGTLSASERAVLDRYLLPPRP